MELVVTQRFEYIGRNGDGLEHESFEATIYRKHDKEPEEFLTPSIPADYVSGLMRCYIDGRSASLADFDAALLASSAAARESIRLHARRR